MVIDYMSSDIKFDVMPKQISFVIICNKQLYTVLTFYVIFKYLNA